VTDSAATPAPPTAPFADSSKVTALVSLAHLYSHFFYFVLPPLFPLLRSDLTVTYTELGALIVVFNAVSALTQLPIGVLVDRLDAPRLLTGAVAVQGLALMAIGIAPSYWVLMVMMVPAGLANAVYHPADYSILNRSVDPKAMGRTFSIHTVSGFAGSAIAPLTMVALAGTIGWQFAMGLVGFTGLIVAFILMQNIKYLTDDSATGNTNSEQVPGQSLRKTALLLMSFPILMGFVFWLFISIAHNGVSSFSVSAFNQMYGMSLVTANAALTAFLAASSAGILLGGVLGDRTSRHDLITIVGTMFSGLAILVMGFSELTLFGIAVAMCIAGFLGGITTPSRDLLIRSVTPKDSMGAVFGFVSTGLNFGGIIVPLFFGWLLDNGQAATVFVIAGVFQMGVVLTVIGMKAGRTNKI
jgi:FSR family fosmidomycin resistance protein-like MFS transporter